jgi:hypothetical protein
MTASSSSSIVVAAMSISIATIMSVSEQDLGRVYLD